MYPRKSNERCHRLDREKKKRRKKEKEGAGHQKQKGHRGITQPGKISRIKLIESHTRPPRTIANQPPHPLTIRPK